MHLLNYLNGLLTIQMKANPDKCHLLLSKDDPRTVNIGNTNITNSKCKKLLGVKIEQ